MSKYVVHIALIDYIASLVTSYKIIGKEMEFKRFI